jgi:hypothetical protein
MPKRHGVSPVTLQFSVQYAIPRKGLKMSRQVIEEAIKYWIEFGEDPAGFVITPLYWQHEDRTTEADDSDRFRQVLGRLLQGGASIRFEMGSHERV